MRVGYRPKCMIGGVYGPLSAVALIALLLGTATQARAVGEIAEPAGALPDDGAARSAGSAADDASADAPAENAVPDQAGDLGLGAADDGLGDTWESYTDQAGQPDASIAQEVTKGVRVEDIVEPPSDYRYASFGKPDPFVPPLITREDVAGAGAVEIPIVSPLQHFALTDLSVVGIWQISTGERKAMIMTPTGANGSGAGQGIIVKNGDPVGNRGGKILAIGDDFLTVREFTLAPDGTRQYEDHQLYNGKNNPDEIPGRIRFTPGAKSTEVLFDKDSATASKSGDAALKPGVGGGTADAATFAPGTSATPDPSGSEPTALSTPFPLGPSPVQPTAQPATNDQRPTAYRPLNNAVAAPAANATPGAAQPVTSGAAQNAAGTEGAPSMTGGGGSSAVGGAAATNASQQGFGLGTQAAKAP